MRDPCASSHRIAHSIGLSVIVLAAFMSTVEAQQLPTAPDLALPQARQAPAEKTPPTAGKQKKGFWYKLCDQQPKTKRKICFTFHEQVNVKTGRLYVSAALRKVAESKTEHILVVVPPGIAVRPGLQITIDDKKPIILKYVICQPKGCTAEGEASAELIAQMRAGKNMIVAVIDVAGKINNLRVPLDGFSIAHKGPAVDKELYFKAWRSQLDQLRRQKSKKAPQ